VLAVTSKFSHSWWSDRLTPESDFTASSELGIDGTVEINTRYRQFEVLPAEFRNVEIAQGCQAGGGQAQSEFRVTGRGGLPPQPGEPLRTEAVVVNEGRLEAGIENRSESVTSTPPTPSAPAQLVEAQGWVVNTRGQVVLTASAPTATPDSSWSTPATCHAP
jgi:large exoprotein involved in heme utilization and adhesion